MAAEMVMSLIPNYQKIFTTGNYTLTHHIQMVQLHHKKLILWPRLGGYIHYLLFLRYSSAIITKRAYAAA